MKKYDVIIIGAGAAGMMCAIEAGKRGRSVLLVDHAKKVGEKIRISGGGRCNFTNYNIAPDRYISQNPYFAISALKRYTQWDFIDLIEKSGIAYHEKTLGQLFCDGSAKQINDMLLEHMNNVGVELLLNTSVNSIKKDSIFEVDLSCEKVQSKSLVVACGGKSIPKMGATGLGYKIAEQFGVDLIKTRAGLVPFTLNEADLQLVKEMAGTSLYASVTCNKTVFDEGFLFTHRGVSGPSILQISSYWNDGDSISVNMLPKVNMLSVLKQHKRDNGSDSILKVINQYLPKKVSNFVVEETGVVRNIADQSDERLGELSEFINSWQVNPNGTEGYRTAEVTLGGVNTDCLNPKTMEAKNIKGLYFIGEVVDVTGWLGGYNFQWAWSSGWVAGQGI